MRINGVVYEWVKVQWGGRANTGVGPMSEQPMEKEDQQVNGMGMWAIR